MGFVYFGVCVWSFDMLLAARLLVAWHAFVHLVCIRMLFGHFCAWGHAGFH